MKIQTKHAQRGQSMAEFVAAMALFLPLAMGIIYAGKYADIKHQAVQASRYAALERAMDPNGMQSNAVVGNETVARFFRDAGRHQTIGFQDQATAATAGDENPNWAQLSGDPMIENYSKVSVTFPKDKQGSLHSASLEPTVDVSADSQFKHLNTGVGIEADVAVQLANIAHFLPLSNINITVGATTVMAGDPWNAGGASSVNDHIDIGAVPAKAYTADPLFGPLKPVLDTLYQALSDTNGPQFGCVKPDVVPQSVAPNANYDPRNANPDAVGANECFSN